MAQASARRRCTKLQTGLWSPSTAPVGYSLRGADRTGDFARQAKLILPKLFPPLAFLPGSIDRIRPRKHVRRNPAQEQRRDPGAEVETNLRNNQEQQNRIDIRHYSTFRRTLYPVTLRSIAAGPEAGKWSESEVIGSLGNGTSGASARSKVRSHRVSSAPTHPQSHACPVTTSHVC
jgi:hypothetical protein